MKLVPAQAQPEGDLPDDGPGVGGAPEGPAGGAASVQRGSRDPQQRPGLKNSIGDRPNKSNL